MCMCIYIYIYIYMHMHDMICSQICVCVYIYIYTGSKSVTNVDADQHLTVKHWASDPSQTNTGRCCARGSPCTAVLDGFVLEMGYTGIPVYPSKSSNVQFNEDQTLNPHFQWDKPPFSNGITIHWNWRYRGFPPCRDHVLSHRGQWPASARPFFPWSSDLQRCFLPKLRAQGSTCFLQITWNILNNTTY